MIVLAMATVILLSDSSLNARYMGETTCASWTSGGSYFTMPKAAALNWVLGFIYSAGADRRLDLLGTTNQQAVAEWLDDYCRREPSGTIITGAHRLRDELVSQHGSGE